MTDEQAIKELNTLKLPIKTEQDHRRHQAIRLGIEALKRIQEARVKYHSVWGDTLPGEDEEI